MDGVPVRYRWTLAEQTEAQRWHLRQSKVRRIVPAVCWVLAGLLACSAISIYRRQGTLAHAPGTVIGIAYFLVLSGLIPLLTRWRVRRNHAGASTRDAEVTWQITAASLRFEHAHGSSEVKWAAFNKAALAPTGLLLYSQPLIFHWLPRHGFESEEGFEAVAAWARQNIPAFRVLR